MALSHRSTGAAAVMKASGAGVWDLVFRTAIMEILRPRPATPALAWAATMMGIAARTASPVPATLTLRQWLTEQGVAVLGLILQPKLIYPDQRPFPAPQTEPESPTDDATASTDRAERSATHLAFRARMAAARICLSKGVLDAALRALHRERRACLQALQDRIAARRAMQAHERLARGFCRTAALTARGMPHRPVSEAPEDTNARVQASILNKLDG